MDCMCKIILHMHVIVSHDVDFMEIFQVIMLQFDIMVRYDLLFE